MNERVRWTVIAAACALALGCGSSKDTSGGDSTDDAGPSGGGGGSKSNGTGGTTTTGTGGTPAVGTGGVPGGAIVKNVPCGSNVCAGAEPTMGGMMLPGFMLAQTCCADEAAGTCGSISADDMTTCVAPPMADSRCPKAFGMTGCCTTDNHCGIDGSLGGRGCIDLVEISGMIPAAFRAMVMLPDPVTCDGMPIALDGGAGDQDAGQ